jgi:HK97 family phage portal protein
VNKLVQNLFFSKAAGDPSQAVAAYSLLFQRSGVGSFGNMRYKDAVKHGYSSLVWVYRCIKKRGEAVGSVPWKVSKKGPEGELTPLPGHPLEQLLAKPNPYTDRKQFFEGWSTYLDLSGNSYMEVVYVQGKPKSLYSLRPDWMLPIPDPTLYLKGYELKPDGQKKILLEPQDVIHFKYIDPLDEYVGMSPLTAASRTLQTENAIVSWNKSMLDNNAMPGGVLKVPAQTLIPEDRKSLQEEIESEFAGDHRHSPMILWGGMEWEQLGLSQKDMDFLEQRGLNKYEICAVFGVPPQVVGAQVDPTYSNYSVARLSFWEDTVMLILDWLQAQFNSRLAPFWGPDIVCHYDISDVPAMRESFLQKVKTAETLWKMGWDINSINDRLNLGLPARPWGNTAWFPSSLVPVGAQFDEEGQPIGPTAEPEDSEPQDQPGEEEEPTNPYAGTSLNLLEDYPDSHLKENRRKRVAEEALAAKVKQSQKKLEKALGELDAPE